MISCGLVWDAARLEFVLSELDCAVSALQDRGQNVLSRGETFTGIVRDSWSCVLVLTRHFREPLSPDSECEESRVLTQYISIQPTKYHRSYWRSCEWTTRQLSKSNYKCSTTVLIYAQSFQDWKGLWRLTVIVISDSKRDLEVWWHFAKSMKFRKSLFT